MNRSKPGALGPSFLGASLVAVLLVTPVRAQEFTTLPPALDRATLIDILEAGAADHPAVRAESTEPLYWSEVPGVGTSERTCVDMPEHGPVRSGDFRLTFWAVPFQAGRRHKVAWSPVDDSSRMSLRVQGRLVSDPDVTMEFTTSSLGRTIPSGNSPAEDTWRFFPTGMLFPEPGEWIVVATSRENWGCFIFSVGTPGAAAP